MSEVRHLNLAIIDATTRPFVVEWLRDRSAFHTWLSSLITGSFVVLTVFGSTPGFGSPGAVVKDCVILLHGLGRTSASMHRLEHALTQDGYIVVNQSYPSRKQPIRELSGHVDGAIATCLSHDPQYIHFVTHSLGGILVRYYFQDHVVAKAQRMVMIGPPNQGSEVVDKYKKQWWFRLFAGPAGQELGTDAASLPSQLKAVSLEIGVIAGTASLDPWFYGSVSRPNDGKVAVSSTMLPEMKDFITVAHSHTFMVSADPVLRQVKHFLRLGRFAHETRPGTSE